MPDWLPLWVIVLGLVHGLFDLVLLAVLLVVGTRSFFCQVEETMEQLPPTPPPVHVEGGSAAVEGGSASRFGEYDVHG
jgi:hypothetical protein